MKKVVNIAFAAYVTLAGLSYLNAAEAPAEVDLRLVMGCKNVMEKVYCCPLELPGFYQINPAQLDAFLDRVPAAREFYEEQKAVAAKAGLSPDNYAKLTEFQTVQVITQAYFKGTGVEKAEGDYVYAIPFVKGNEDAVLAAAQATGLVAITRPLEAYVTYKHLGAIIGEKRTLVLCCGNASINKELYDIPRYYTLDRTGFVSSGCYCDHSRHVTVSKAPGILPTIVANIFDPTFQAELSIAAATFGGFEAIIDEDGILGNEYISRLNAEETAREIAFFKSLLAKDGKLIACEHPGFKVL